MKVLSLVLVVLMAASCASTGGTGAAKSAATGATVTPVGNWDYVVLGTPQGDFSGVMSITSADSGYAARISSPAGEITMNQFRWDDSAGKVAGVFSFTGFPVMFDAALAAGEMTGYMSVDGMQFPFKATRKT